MLKIILAILIFSFIVIFHEFGHFITAKLSGIRVNEFMVGLGPKLIGFTKGETTYSINLLPFGGACVMEGEDQESSDERSFNNKSVFTRILVVVAGPVFNFILAYLLSVIMLGVMGYNPPTISGVSEGSAAYEAGIQEGDTIISLNNYRVRFYQEISVYNFLHPGEEMNVTFERDGKRQTVSLTPKYNEEYGRYLLGVTSNGQRIKGSVWNILCYSAYELKYQIYVTYESLVMLFTGQVSMNEMSGPVGIVKTIGDTYDESLSSGALYVVMNLINLTILLSANIGFMNLLPIPALDGGRLLIYIVEVIRRKRMDLELEAKINYIGFAALMALMILIMFNDIRKLIM